MSSPHDPLPTSLAACHERIRQLEAIVRTQQATITELQLKLEQLAADNALLKRELFGSRRERFIDDSPPNSPAAEPPTDPSNAAATEQSPPPQQQEEKKKRTSRGRRRRKFPECMPREQRLIYLKPEENAARNDVGCEKCRRASHGW
jgi:hypothetical protein